MRINRETPRTAHCASAPRAYARRGLALAGLALIAGVVAGCGFKLREEVALPPSMMQVRFEGLDPYAPLRRDLAAALERAGATVVEADGADVAVVRALQNALVTEPLTISESARVKEYLVRYTVEIEIADGAGKPVLARTPIVLERDYSYDETQALGAAAEEELLRRELQREMVQQVLRRIERVK